VIVGPATPAQGRHGRIESILKGEAYGYAHAVRVGDDIKISGAVSMDDKGDPTAVGDLEQQMKNAYSDLDKVLKHSWLEVKGLALPEFMIEIELEAHKANP
jgi:2-iminobutanoate/2-iminopropanoate deaminase